ncbi:single-stranded DNA-binding protein [Janibacter terrae]|uniref:single-stranded DNA-binding protein n=1 Tax=Janibacter terrae TaxID=103817 RepID=UPI0031F72D88
MNEPTIILIGNATGDAELRFTPSGHAVANINVAVNPRDKQGDQWVDGEPNFYRVAAWKDLAENVAESVKRGDRVTVVGRLRIREYEHNGEKRTSLDVTADSVALDLRFATAAATKAQRNGGGQGQQPAQSGAWGGGQTQADPWGQQPAQQPQTGGAGNAAYDEPPF